MPVPSDPFTFADGPGNVASGVQVNARFDALYAALTGALDTANLSAALVPQLGLTDGGVVRRGKSIIATEEARTNVAYGLLATPDRVQSVVLPTDGLIVMGYHAMWKESANGVARAAIFLGSNQIVGVSTSGTPTVTPAEAVTGASVANTYWPLVTAGNGLYGAALSTVYAGPVTTGQVLGTVGASGGGGLCAVFAAAGTYDVSVQFKALSAGTVTAKNRKLWVWAMGF